ncbi:hypothetical protein [Vibrio sp. St2]|uniref:hypothetical protein n=1 Tax=Vibrio sp. St2 TaxID=2853441 RepID=UPI00248DD318|nr:hypothetical protein [Vibrio sp. St2]
MSNFLFVGDLRLQFHFCEYPHRIKLAEGDFYMDFNCLQRKTTNIPITFRLSKCYELSAKDDEGYLHNMIKEWRRNTLALYRGFPGCHFCWPDLLMGELKSEGTNDYPEFTMSDTGKGTTCWLPAAEKNIAQGVSIQCCDQFTLGLSMQEDVAIPIGFTVRIPVGKSQGQRICWLNSGEILVRGPLMSGQYNMDSITWMKNGGPSFTSWPAQFPNLFLPPQRPFQPAHKPQIEDWWKTCKRWMDEVPRSMKI